MTLTNKRKAELRWEVVDAAFDRIETLAERGDDFTPEDEAYLRRVIERAAKALNVLNHIYLRIP